MKRVIVVAAIGCLAACTPGKSGNPALPSVTLLSPDSANHMSARFSPDGSRLFWWEPAGQGNQLWTADAKLGNATKVPVTSLQTTPFLWSPDGSQVAVGSSSSGYMQVAVIPAAGGEPKVITKVTFAVPMSWNPDGDRFIYGALAGDKGGGTVHSFITSVKNGGSNPLIPSELKPSLGVWSPDGSHIAYMVFDGGHSVIWVADSAGRNARQLTTDGFEGFGNSEWIFSPDGKQIAYESRRTGTRDIWVVSVDGGAPRQLTHDIRNDTYPLWSPDGQWIAFLSDRGKQTDIWVMPATGGQELRVTDDASVEELMQWLDGTHLAFLTGQGQSGIWAMSLADSSERRLTPDSLIVGPPILSHDGKQVAFRIERGGGVTDLAVVPVAGGPLRILVSGGANGFMNWSPDDTRIAFHSDRGGSQDIWIVDLAGGEPRQLTNWPGLEQFPAWSGDGSLIYFTADRDARIADIWQVAPSGGEATRVTTVGAINSIMTRKGRPEIFASILDATGGFTTVQVNAGGKVVPVTHGTNSFPVDLIPGSDSLVVAEVGKAGSFTFRILPIGAGAHGDGAPLLNLGEDLAGTTDDWSKVIYKIATGATHDIGVLDRKTGERRRLTNTSMDESAAAITPDGKTVLFQRSRNIRRIAIADLTKLLAAVQK